MCVLFGAPYTACSARDESHPLVFSPHTMMSPATLLCFFLQAFAALAQSPQMPTVITEGGHMASMKHEISMSNGGGTDISVLEPNGNTKW